MALDQAAPHLHGLDGEHTILVLRTTGEHARAEGQHTASKFVHLFEVALRLSGSKGHAGTEAVLLRSNGKSRVGWWLEAWTRRGGVLDHDGLGKCSITRSIELSSARVGVNDS